MTYRIEGLPPEPFQPLFDLDDRELESMRARRVTADSDRGFPCRVSLEEAKAGDRLVLVNYVSHDVPTPFRTAYGIYVKEGATQPAPFDDCVPPLLDTRTLGLRAFDSEGMLCGGLLAHPGEADVRIRSLFEQEKVVSIHAHNAAYGCFLAKIERSGS